MFQAFKELHEKLLYASQKIKLADLQIDTLRRTKQHNILTKQELEVLKFINIVFILFIPMYIRIGLLL